MARAPLQPPMPPPPIPTPIYRIVHIASLPTLVRRGAIHSPSHVPADGLPWISIHAAPTQAVRGQRQVPCGPGGVIQDYIGFYFGPRSPMLFRIHTGHNVAQVHQSNIAYLVTTAQAVSAAGLGFVFTDRHSLARVATFHDDLAALTNVDFIACQARQWNTTPQHPDRQEKKQAEFLVHGSMPWALINEIGTANAAAAARVAQTLNGAAHTPPVSIQPGWYY